MNTDKQGPSESATTQHETALTQDLLARLDAYWCAANNLSVGQIYLRDNPLLRQPFKLAHVKHMLIGRWGGPSSLERLS